MKRPNFRLTAIAVMLFGGGLSSLSAQADSLDPIDLNLEELMNVVVTSVSKKSQTLADTPAAVHVITADDIRRSGATNIPEALRLAPGVQVSAVGNNKWAVSIRGFADRFTNKLLVLVDGRSVYTPLFSGVIWEALDMPLENIARIEVIRGPGASIWGANAVNGVINIITQSPFDNLGSRVALAGGTELVGYGYARHGWSPDPDTAVSIHAKLHDVDASRKAGGGDGVDDWQQLNAGFKLERLLDKSQLKVQGGVSRSLASDQLTMLTVPPMAYQQPGTQRISNSHMLVRWEGESSTGRQDSFQAYLDASSYRHVVLEEERTTADLEYQQRLKLGDRHDVTWGLGYRYSADRVTSSPMLVASERKRNTSLYSLFFQDEITLQPEHWRLTLGGRLEHNDYTGYVFQPNLRLLWTPSAQTSAWVSIARAARTPSRIERGGYTYTYVNPYAMPPAAMQLNSIALKDEQLDAFDIGWRHQVNRNLSIDVSAFVNQYDKLRGAALTTPQFVFPPGYVLLPLFENNANTAVVRGLETSVDWRITPSWRLQGHYSWMKSNVTIANIPGQMPGDFIGVSPRNIFSLRSSLDLTSGLQWDAWIRHSSRITNDYFTAPAFTTLDIRIGWKARRDLEVSLVGQNLLDSVHPEFGSVFILSAPAELQRGVYLRADWKF